MKMLCFIFFILSFQVMAKEICSVDRKALHDDDFEFLLDDGFGCFKQNQAPLTDGTCKLYAQYRNRSAAIRLEINGQTEWSGIYAKKILWLPTLSSLSGPLPPHVLSTFEEGWKDAFDILKVAVENGVCES